MHAPIGFVESAKEDLETSGKTAQSTCILRYFLNCITQFVTFLNGITPLETFLKLGDVLKNYPESYIQQKLLM